MKTLFISISLLVSSFFASATNTEPAISSSAISSFETAFAKATSVNWQDMGDLYKVSFQLDGVNTTAFYQPDGKFIGVTKNLSSEALPASLRKTLQKGLDKSWITDLIVLNNEEGTTYFVSVETADSKTVLKSVRNKRWAFLKGETK